MPEREEIQPLALYSDREVLEILNAVLDKPIQMRTLRDYFVRRRLKGTWVGWGWVTTGQALLEFLESGHGRHGAAPPG